MVLFLPRELPNFICRHIYVTQSQLFWTGKSRQWSKMWKNSWIQKEGGATIGTKGYLGMQPRHVGLNLKKVKTVSMRRVWRAKFKGCEWYGLLCFSLFLHVLFLGFLVLWIKWQILEDRDTTVGENRVRDDLVNLNMHFLRPHRMKLLSTEWIEWSPCQIGAENDGGLHVLEGM